jgi:tRNA1Val (adenine37-N6)-methyltransferase
LPDQISELFEGERIDLLGRKGLRIIQNPQKFKFTIDAFILAGFIAPKPRHQLIDLGAGSGVLPLLIAGSKEIAHVYGLEIQPELVSMAQRSVNLNKLENKITILEGDLCDLPVSLKPNSFDYVISNPPFFPIRQGIISENEALAKAKFEIGCTLEDVIKAATKLVKANGKVAIIYPAGRLTDIIQTLIKFHLNPVKLRFVYPKSTVNSNLLLLEAKPGSKCPVEVLPPLKIYDINNEYTDEMNRIFNLSTSNFKNQL